MNSKIEKYIESEKKKQKEKLAEYLLEKGVFEVVYAPVEIMGFGRTNGDREMLKFPIKNKNIKIGETMKVSRNGEIIDITIEKVKVIQNVTDAEYPFETYEEGLDFFHKYKKIPLELSDKEYDELKGYLEEKTVLGEGESNGVAKMLGTIAWITYIAGAIAGLILAGSSYEFSWVGAIALWCAAFVNGTTFLGFAEIIKLLEKTKRR